MRVQLIQRQRSPRTGSKPGPAWQGKRAAVSVSEAAALPVLGENHILFYPNILLHSLIYSSEDRHSGHYSPCEYTSEYPKEILRELIFHSPWQVGTCQLAP